MTVMAITAAITSRAISITARRTGLVLLVLLFDIGHQILAELLRLLNHGSIRASNMQVHVFVTLTTC